MLRYFTYFAKHDKLIYIKLNIASRQYKYLNVSNFGRNKHDCSFKTKLYELFYWLLIRSNLDILVLFSRHLTQYEYLRAGFEEKNRFPNSQTFPNIVSLPL